MSIEYLFYGTVFLVALMGLVIAFVALSYKDVITQLFALKKEKEKLSKLTESETDKIIQEARASATKIVQQAQLLSEETKNQIAKELKSVVELQAKQYQVVMNETRVVLVKTISEISEELRKAGISQINDFQARLSADVANAQISIKQSLDQMSKKLDADMVAYQQFRFKQVDSMIVEILRYVTKDYLRKTLRPEDHEQIIIDALDEAKKQNVTVNN